MLTEALTAAKGLSGSGVDHYLPVTLGQLALCEFHLGRAAEALPRFEQALALCRRCDDAEGQIAYLSSLHEVHRWLGDTARAIDYGLVLVQRCDELGHHERARHVERKVGLMRAGEPLLRVLVELGGRTLELEELPSPLPDGPVRFQFERNRMSLGGVTALVDEGSHLGNAGEYARALSTFAGASALDPTDPGPVYLAALTLLELGRYDEAIAHYDRVEQLAPGWYHSRANRWLAVELAAGRVAPSVFAATRAIQDGVLPPAEQARLALVTLAHQPAVPLLHLLHAQALFKLGSTEAAAHAAHTGLQLQPDIDVQTRLLFALALASPPGQRSPLLERAIALDGNKIAAAMAQLLLRAEPKL